MSCLHFDHVTFWVSNAKQAASYYVAFLGFQPLAYKGLETGSREVAAHAVVQNKVVFLFVSPLSPANQEFGSRLQQHGDFVKDIAFTVDQLDPVVSRSKENGATLLSIRTEKDADGCVRLATISTGMGDITHTFVERGSYAGLFLPGFAAPRIRHGSALPSPGLQFVDHCVCTSVQGTIDSSCDWYTNNLAFHRFWSVDDVDVETSNSSLKFLVVANNSETIKLNILEPAPGKRKSQVQEFNEYNDGPGIQHIALHTSDIIQSVKDLRVRGVDFLEVPDSYYALLRKRLSEVKVEIREDLDELERQRILLDYDESGYLLQIFTKPMQDRPTLFLEVIQRHNHNGFGAGNFRTLFLAVEMEQEKRGNL